MNGKGEDNVPNLIVVGFGFAFGSGAGWTSAAGIARKRATYIFLIVSIRSMFLT